MKWTPTNYPLRQPVDSDQLLIRDAGSGELDSTTVAALRDAASPFAVVGSIVDLRARIVSDAQDGELAVLAGYYGAGTPGGGSFYYDAESVAADNGGTIIAPDEGDGRWIRTYDGPVNPMMFGCRGNGIQDDGSRLQLCMTAGAGGSVDLLGGYTFLTSLAIEVLSGTRVYGHSAIKAAANAGLLNGILYGDEAEGVTIEGVEIDGNAGSLGANFGISFGNGFNNHVVGVYVHDTLQAGFRAFSETGTRVIGGRFIDCGRNGYTDNHGIMLYSITSTPFVDCLVDGARVENAYRKGITTYAAGVGVLENVRIVNTYTEGCGLGGVYCATAAGGIAMKGIVIDSNVADDNYVNFTLENSNVSSMTSNISRGAAHFGYNVDAATDCLVEGNIDEDSAIYGIIVTATTGTTDRVICMGNIVRRPNRSNQGTGAGILISNTLRSIVSQNIVTDESPGTLMTHGILEQGTSDYNQITDNHVENATSALITISGANTNLRQINGALQGNRTASPNNNLDLNGGMTIRTQAWTLANGANNNVALPSNAGTLVSNAPSGVYNITGIAGGVDGRIITIINYTTFTMTLTHNSGSSSVGNKIFCPGATDLAITQFGTARLQWSSITNAWNAEF